MLKKIKLFLQVFLTSLMIFNILNSYAHAETLTKLEKPYTNEAVMTYLLDNITIYINKPIYGTTWATFRNNWESETDNVVFFYYYNNNASASYARTAAFYYGNISYNTTSYNAPNTNNLTLIRGGVLNNLGNNDGQAYYSYYSNFSAQWGSNINNNYLKYYLYKDDNGDWWQYTNNSNISLENIQTGLDFELASTKSITNYQDDGLYWYFQYQYNSSQWLLGWFNNANEFDEVEFKLIDDLTNVTISTTYATSGYNIDGLSISNNSLFLDSYKVYLNQRYKIEYICYKDGEIVDCFFYPIVFMYRNAVISDGVVSSIGSGDGYTIQNSVNDIINHTISSGDLVNILGSPPSGDQPRNRSYWFFNWYCSVRRL